jgi:hypothetical protein
MLQNSSENDMGIRAAITRTIGQTVFNLGAGKSLDDFPARLEASGAKIRARLDKLNDSDVNRRVLNHIIGIERWGQRRLKVALGEPFIQDEYNGYRPARETAWETLKMQFAETRAETVALARTLAAQPDAASKRIRHNDYGNLLVGGWLNYLRTHAELESRKLR